MEALNSIFTRRSIRKYKTDKKISTDVVDNLLKAACSAPSAHNSRPWEFIVIRNRETINKLRGVIVYYEKPLCEAPLAIAVLVNPTDKPRTSLEYMYQDCAASMQNIITAATSQGLGSCWMGGLLADEETANVKEILNIPDKIHFFGLLSLGYPNEEKEPRGVIETEKVHEETY